MDFKTKLLISTVSIFLVILPFLVTRFPPITDLPQHASQVRLFLETINSANSPYKINWLTPYSLPYPLIGLCWLFFGPSNAGRIALGVIAAILVSIIFYLAHSRNRPPEMAVLSSIFIFSHILYWGFFQFLTGWIIFMLWVDFLEKTMKSKKATIAFSLGLGFFLYFAHILWLILSAAWFFLFCLINRTLKKNKLKLTGLIPFLGLGLIWYPTLASYGFRSETIWATTPFQRLSPAWFVDAALGAIRGPQEAIILCLIIGWIGLSIWQNKKNLSSNCYMCFLYLAAFLFFLALILPDKHTNTIRFAQRWVPPAVVFMLLATPPIKLSLSLRSILSIVLLTFMIFITATTWKAFEKYELSGLSDALDLLPEKSRLLGLSFLKQSDLVRGRPFVQIFAYGQVIKGGELNFSFADFGPSLVVYKEKRRPAWTPALEWFPELVRESDFTFFDFILVSGDEKVRAIFAQNAKLKSLNQDGRWRLYQVKK